MVGQDMRETPSIFVFSVRFLSGPTQRLLRLAGKSSVSNLVWVCQSFPVALSRKNIASCIPLALHAVREVISFSPPTDCGRFLGVFESSWMLADV